MSAPLLIALPSNLIVSGVATWAARLVSALCESGRVAGLIVHAPPPGHVKLDIRLHPAVRVYDLSHLGLLESVTSTDHDSHRARETWTGAYLEAIRDLHAAGGATGPVVLSPNLHADCYAVCLEAARREPGMVRLVGWQHNDIEYDRRVLRHYEPAMAALVGVSDHITSRLGSLLPGREIMSIPYGVEVPDAPPRRTPLMTGGRVRAVRLLYTGRLDHHQKRVLALPHLSRALFDAGINHELTILGDGPASADLDQLIEEVNPPQAHRPTQSHQAGRPSHEVGGPRAVAHRAEGVGSNPLILASPTAAMIETCSSERGLCLGRASRLPIHRQGPASPTQVREALTQHDCFVLPSRFEGLSVSMLEALAAGCVPIVARVESGALQAITPGVTGLIADVAPEADEHAVGVALAREVSRVLALDAAAMARAAWASARERYSLRAHAGAVCVLIDRIAGQSELAWPKDRPVWFSDLGGSIPLDAPQRVGRLLEQLAGCRVIVHATGLHTRTLLPQLLAGPAIIVGFTDDDRQRHGQTLGGLPIVAPHAAATLGPTDVVISTSLHEQGVWSRRGVYERQGLVVHRLYEETGQP